MSQKFNDKVAIITGGASGIGRALGAELAERGACVVLADIDAKAVEAAAREIASGGAHEARAAGAARRIEGITLDVRDAAAVDALVERVVKEHGRLDLMFNNAGIAVGGMARDFSLDDWMRVLDVNLKGVIHGTHAAYRVMVAQGDGHIVNTSSLAGLVPVPGQASYCTTKHAIVGLSHALRIEGAPLGVRVSVACPAAVDTPIFETTKWINIDAQKLKEKLPGKPESARHCAQAILRGVEKNQATIAPGLASVIWRVHRYVPALSGLMQRAMYGDIDSIRSGVLASNTRR